MRSTVEKDVFKGFQMDDETNFSILQYTEDSIIVGKETQDNLWALKAIFRSYELVSGLRINFHKSSIYGINIDGLFLQAAENFLHCNIGILPLKFLGIPIGANPRKCHTWAPIIVIF